MNSEAHAIVFWLRGTAIAACCVVCICLASCAGSSGQSKACTPPSIATGSIQAGDDQNGESITLHPGQKLAVTLCSTYWSFQGSSNLQVLAPAGAPVESPAPFNACPVAGSGCGSVSEAFRVVKPGTAQVTASRVSCGEAMGCTSATGHYQLTVKVTVGS